MTISQFCLEGKFLVGWRQSQMKYDKTLLTQLLTLSCIAEMRHKFQLNNAIAIAAVRRRQFN
ncbi:MAG TPA: hypothetical protein QGF63_08655, partial [Alphaproteobacteria bacterium]|nr:hypothetical protein [Alphaproteobacteria bacterium]